MWLHCQTVRQIRIVPACTDSKHLATFSTQDRADRPAQTPGRFTVRGFTQSLCKLDMYLHTISLFSSIVRRTSLPFHRTRRPSERAPSPKLENSLFGKHPQAVHWYTWTVHERTENFTAANP